MDEREELGARLKEARKYLNLSQTEVSDSLNIPRSAVSLAEAGKRRIDTGELKKFADLYYKSVSELLGEETKEPSKVKHLQRAAKGLTEHDQDQLLQFAKFLEARSQKAKD